MKFPTFKLYEQGLGSLSDVIRYLSVEMSLNLKELVTGLRRLSFQDNFESFEVEVIISAGSELAIRNELRDGAIPTKRLIVRGKDGVQNLVDGDTTWDKNFVYLKNIGATSLTATVVFLK